MSQVEQYEPKVNKVNEFLEIASDFEDPLEVIRESLSNSYDARASEVYITIRSTDAGSDIIIEDDGAGMDRRDLESFFDLGNSRKTEGIGYKGHGTKIFYKSDHIVVNTAKDGTNFRATMADPWEKLNNRVLPTYEVSESSTRSGTDGTHIKISGFKSGKGFEPSSLTYNKIEHYLKWKTIAGSTAPYFGDEHHEMDIIVELDDAIDDTREKLVTTNQFEFPDQQLEPTDGQFPTERMCKVYDGREIEFETDHGTSTVQLIGMIGGKQARDELPTYGRHSAQFGVWLAKDHIKVERINDVISSDNEFIHFFFVANCQDIELSANREKVRNKSSSVYQTLKVEVKHYLSKVISDPWFQDYLEQRKIEKQRRRVDSQQRSLQERREAVSDQDRFSASNDLEVVIGLERSNDIRGNSTVRVEDFDPSADVSAILSVDGALLNGAVSPNLTDYFEDERPLESVDTIVCWDVGDHDDLREFEREGYLNSPVSFDHETQVIRYGAAPESEIDVITVKDRLHRSARSRQTQDS